MAASKSASVVRTPQIVTGESTGSRQSRFERIKNPSKSPFTPWKTAGYSTHACIVHLPRGRLYIPLFEKETAS
jgi:hypothetical protein